MLEYVNEFRLDQNNVLRFVHEACLIGQGYEVTVRELYRRYVAWCKDQGEKSVPNNVFGRIVPTVNGVKFHRTSTKGRHYIGLRPNDP
ncbi:hypothetical protein D3C86_1504080 [compost metagenome]